MLYALPKDMTTTNMTDLECAALTNLLTSGYADGEEPTVWDWCATGGIVTAAKVGGVIASLVKKGFVGCQGRGDDATITITVTGMEAYKATK